MARHFAPYGMNPQGVRLPADPVYAAPAGLGTASVIPAPSGMQYPALTQPRGGLVAMEKSSGDDERALNMLKWRIYAAPAGVGNCLACAGMGNAPIPHALKNLLIAAGAIGLAWAVLGATQKKPARENMPSTKKDMTSWLKRLEWYRVYGLPKGYEIQTIREGADFRGKPRRKYVIEDAYGTGAGRALTQKQAVDRLMSIYG